MLPITRLIFLALAIHALTTHHSVSAHGDHDEGNGHQKAGAHFDPDNLWDSQVLQNTAHIQEDLEEFFSVRKDDMSKITPRELEYYYFELHDFDKNRKLDGLELLKAVIHMIQHATKDGASAPDRLESFATAIDQVLETDDLDKDGFLSYPEFVQTMKKHEDGQKKHEEQKEDTHTDEKDAKEEI